MGNVDLHNRYRQGMLGLHRVWKTTTWQARVQSEIFAMCAVDAFLLSQHFLPKWSRNNWDGDEESKLFAWLGALTGSLIEMVEENDNVARAETAVQEERVCRQVPIGRKKIKTGVGEGSCRAIQQRCRYCSLAGKKEITNCDSNAKPGSCRTTFTCSIHSDFFMCRMGKNNCWAEHLEEVRCLDR